MKKETIQKIIDNLIIIAAAITIVVGIFAFNLFEDEASFASFLTVVYLLISFILVFLSNKWEEKELRLMRDKLREE